MAEFIYDSAARIGYQADQYAQVDKTIALARYVTGPNALDEAERDAIFAAKLGILPIWETAADEAEHPERGAGDAADFVRRLHALGFTVGCAAAMADDHNDSSPLEELGYFGGAHPVTVGYLQLMCYSGANVVAACMEAGVCELGWQVETWTQYGDFADEHLTQLANTKNPIPPGIDPGAYDVNVVRRPFPIWGLEAPITQSPLKKGPRGMFIALDYDRQRCWLFAGQVRIHDFDFAPAGAFGIPQQALDFDNGRGMISAITSNELDLLDIVSKSVLATAGL